MLVGAGEAFAWLSSLLQSSVGRLDIDSGDWLVHRHLRFAVQGDALDSCVQQVARLVAVRAEQGGAHLEGDLFLVGGLLSHGEALGLQRGAGANKAADLGGLATALWLISVLWQRLVLAKCCGVQKVGFHLVGTGGGH